VARQVVVEIQANAGTATGALQDVQAKIDQVKQGFRATGDAGEEEFARIGGAAANAAGQITGSMQKAINQTAKDFQRFGDITLQSFSRIEAASEDLQRRQQLIGNQADELAPKIQNAYVDGIESVKGFERAVETTYDELVERTGQGLQATDSMEAAFADLQQRAQLAESGLQDVARVQGRISTTGQTMRSSLSSSSNNLAFELTQAAQDAKFGLAGVANQIPLISEQFTQLSAKAGGVRGAFSELASTFFGPIGLLAGVTLATQFLPELTSLFSDAEDSAEKSADKIEKLGSAVNSVVDVVSGNTADLEINLDQVNSAINTTENQILALEQLSRIDPVGGVLPFAEIDRQAPAATQQLIQGLAEESEGPGILAEDVEQRLQDERAIRKQLDKQQSELERQLRLQERLQQLGATAKSTEEKRLETLISLREELQEIFAEVMAERELGEEAGTIRRQIEAFEEQLELEKEINRILSEREDITRAEAERIARTNRALEGLQNLDIERPDSGPAGADGSGLTAAQQRLADLGIEFRNIQADIENGFIGPVRGSIMQVENLRDTLRLMRSDEIQASTEEIEDMEDKLSDVAERAVKLQLAFQAVGQFSQAFGDEIGSAIVGDPGKIDQLRNRRGQLRNQLRQSLRQGNFEEVRQLRRELSKVNNKLDTATSLFERLGQAFNNLGSIARRVLQQLIADLTAAVTRAVLLSAISAAFGGGGFSLFGQLFTNSILGGGSIQGNFFAGGGKVAGPGTSTSDSIPARLSDGEFVVNAASTSAAPALISAINESPSFAAQLQNSMGRVRTFARGGLVGGQMSIAGHSTQREAGITLEITGETRTRGGDIVTSYDVTKRNRRRKGRVT